MAERIVLYLFKQDEEKLERFAESLEALKHLNYCQRCFHISEREHCDICEDGKRDPSVLCVVEEPMDVIALEKSGGFSGRYHCLGGVIESGREEDQAALRIPELLRRIPEEGVHEVILALNPTTEGDLTALYLKKKLSDIAGLTVTRLARGLATGGDIEYADEMTLRSALTNREKLV
jgi:recombination protein RecR